MTTLLFERRFWPAIASGEKVNTIRRTRKRPICPGDSLSLRGWEGKAYRSKQCVLCDETCIAVRNCWIDGSGIVIDGMERFWWDEPEADAFAKSDGFEGAEEMRNYWQKLPFSGDLIQWGVHPMLAAIAKATNRSETL